MTINGGANSCHQFQSCFYNNEVRVELTGGWGWGVQAVRVRLPRPVRPDS